MTRHDFDSVVQSGVCSVGWSMQGAGVEIYPGSVCSLVGNGIHHCKDGILIKVRKRSKWLTHNVEFH